MQHNDSPEVLSNPPLHPEQRNTMISRKQLIDLAAYKVIKAAEFIPAPAPARKVLVPVAEEVHRYQQTIEHKAEVAREVEDIFVERARQQVELAAANPLIQRSASAAGHENVSAIQHETNQLQSMGIDEFNRQIEALSKQGDAHV